jgi:L-iditol 2-dehydrogenase
MAELLRVSAQMVRAGGVVRIPKRVSTRAAAMAEPLACCLHALHRSRLVPGGRVLIIGDGPIGLAFLQLARLMGAAFAATIGRRPARRALAQSLGADEALDARDPSLAGVLATRFDLVIVATSNPDVLDQAVQAARPGGEILLFSGYRHGTRFAIELNDIHYRELSLFGSIDATIDAFHQAVGLLPQLRMEQLVSETYGLDDAARAFETAGRGDVVKVLIEPSGGS